MRHKNTPGYLDFTTQGVADKYIIEHHYEMIEKIRKDTEKKVIQRLIQNIVDEETRELIHKEVGRR